MIDYRRPSDLPEFDHPPVTEVIIAIQFVPLPLRTVDIGALWTRFEDEYPIAEDRPPLPPRREVFVSPELQQSIQFEVVTGAQLNQAVFLVKDRSRIVQVQADRFQCAWRRTLDLGQYPRYSALRQDFVRNAGLFVDFCDEAPFGDIPVYQAEITYLNDLIVNDALPVNALDRVLTTWRPPVNSSFGLSAEEVRVVQRYTYEDAQGFPYARLHFVAEPAVTERGQVLRLAFTFRGEPVGASRRDLPPFDGIMSFLDEGHDRIVQAFAGITTHEMHEQWGRRQ